jgi:hypothetical protein
MLGVTNALAAIRAYSGPQELTKASKDKITGSFE